MLKRFFLVFVLVFVLSESVFSQNIFTDGVFSGVDFKHQRGDIYLGVNIGMGFTPNFFRALPLGSSFPEGNYALTFDLGLSYDYYQIEWLSFNAGLIGHFGMYVFLDQDLTLRSNTGFTDIASTPLSLTIPLSAHINIPYLDFLYTGIGVSLNIPLVTLFDSDDPEDSRRDMTGDVFLGIPIDLGFDFIPPDSGGMRFFFRVTPEFHRSGTVVPIGFMWQAANFKIR